MAYDDLLKIRTWSADGTRTANITDLLQDKTWSGSYTDCARKLTFDALPQALGELGSVARLYHGADKLFSGRVFSRERSSLGQTVSYLAYDYGIYLKRNSTHLSPRNQTAEAVTRQICAEFGIAVGSLAVTGVKLSRNFLGVSLYQIIQTLYTLAAEQTGKQYQIRFAGDALCVVVKELNGESLRLVPGSNLLSCNTVESIENMVNSVGIYDDGGHRTAVYNSEEGYVALYGMMQQAIKASASDKPADTARELLRENGISTTISAQCIGNPKLITGNTVVVHEPVTGTDGLFWILSDSHSFSRGIYQTKVTLDFRNLMDKQTAGSVPTK